MTDIPGKIIGILLSLFLCIIAPAMTLTLQKDMVARRYAITEMCGLLDEIADSRQYNPIMRRSLSERLASYGLNVDFEVRREMRVVDARTTVSSDAINEQDYTVHYVTVPIDTLTDKTVYFNTGDRVGIILDSINNPTTQAFNMGFLNLFIPKFHYVMYERVR